MATIRITAIGSPNCPSASNALVGNGLGVLDAWAPRWLLLGSCSCSGAGPEKATAILTTPNQQAPSAKTVPPPSPTRTT